MKQFTSGELQKILKCHEEWILSQHMKGERADLSDAYLRGTDLSNVNLRGADLSDAYLRGANLRGADLSGADLRGANLRYTCLSGADLSNAYLSGADLRGANLRYTCLRGADLRDANLRDADLCSTDLSNVNLRGANLSDAYLRGANLRGADLRDANLCDANLRDADLRDVQYNHRTNMYAMACPETGSFIGFKKAGGLIVKLEIPADAKRSSATSRKCRCNCAKVLTITNYDEEACGRNEVASDYDMKFIYRVGEYVKVDDFCEDRWEECAPGIHFFITREEAIQYN